MNKNILFIPGNFGSQLVNNKRKIWINPFQLAFEGFRKLKLGEYKGIDNEKDFDIGINIHPELLIKILYHDFNAIMLKNFNYNAWTYDWRKDIRYSARLLSEYVNRLYRNEKVSLVGHSEGGTVILESLKNLSPEILDKVILLGPSVKGTYASAFAFDGQVEQIPIFNKLTEGIHFDYIGETLRTFTALYQLLPWDIGNLDWWDKGIGINKLDKDRFAIKDSLDLNVSGMQEKISIIMGSGVSTCNGVQWLPDPLRNINKMVSSDQDKAGDGFMLNVNSEIMGCNMFKFDNVEHLNLVKDVNVLNKIVEIINL